jgi:hypothetical protein
MKQGYFYGKESSLHVAYLSQYSVLLAAESARDQGLGYDEDLIGCGCYFSLGFLILIVY